MKLFANDKYLPLKCLTLICAFGFSLTHSMALAVGLFVAASASFIYMIISISTELRQQPDEMLLVEPLSSPQREEGFITKDNSLTFSQPLLAQAEVPDLTTGNQTQPYVKLQKH